MSVGQKELQTANVGLVCFFTCCHPMMLLGGKNSGSPDKPCGKENLSFM